MQSMGRVSCCHQLIAPVPVCVVGHLMGLSLTCCVSVLHPCHPFPWHCCMSHFSLVGFLSVSLYTLPLMVVVVVVVVVVVIVVPPCCCHPSSLLLSFLVLGLLGPPVGHWSSWWLLSSV